MPAYPSHLTHTPLFVDPELNRITSGTHARFAALFSLARRVL
jgi:hypothetical protein